MLALSGMPVYKKEDNLEKLTHRERARLALNPQEPDHVPIDCGGSTCNLVDPLYFKVKEKQLIENLIDTGFDILNPIQPLAEGMSSAELKRDFEGRICFHGG